MAADKAFLPLRFACRQFAVASIVVLVVIVAMRTPAAAAVPGEPFERALALYAQGKLHDSESNLQQALTANSGDRRACTLLLVVAREAGHKPRVACDTKAALPQSLSTAQLFAAIAARNPEIQQSVMQVVQARAELRLAKLAISPEFSVLGRFYPSGVLLSLTQSLFSGFFQRSAGIHQREANLLAAVANYAKVRDAVLERAADNYFTLREAQERIPSLEEELSAATELQRVALVRLENGAMADEQQLTLARSLADAQGRLQQVKGQAAIAAATLNALLARGVGEPLSVTPQQMATALPPDYRQALDAARQHRPEIELALRQLEAAKAGRQVALRDLPRIDLRATWGSSSKDGRGEFLTGPSVGVRATVPLLVVPMQQARSRREQAIIDQLELELGRIIAQTQLETVTAWEALVQTRANLQRAAQQGAATTEALRVAQARHVHAEAGDLIHLAAARVAQAQAAGAATTQKYAVERAAYSLQRRLGIAPDSPLFATADVTAATEVSESTMPKLRALWVWKPEFLENAEERTYLLDFATARRIGTLFVSASANSLTQRADAYRALLATAHERHIVVQALQGEPEWARKENYARALRFVDAVIGFNRAAPAGARFDGIHLDVEPHTLADWKAGQQERIAAEFAGLVAAVARAAHGGGLILAADVNPSLARVTLNGTSVVDSILAQVDETGVMAYRDSADKVIEASSPILERGAAAGKRVWIGVSADRGHLSAAPDPEASDTQLESIAAAVESRFQSAKSFSGVAIHDYRRYRNLILGQETEEPRTAPSRVDEAH